MKILIKNANLISMSEKREKFESNIDILIKDNKIVKIARNIQEEAQKVIDATGKIVMPGLINTHSHIGMSIFRETLEGYTTQDWLQQKIWPMEEKLTASAVYYATLLSCIEMIKTGTTTINDMYFFTEEIIKAALQIGVRLQTSCTFIKNDENIINELKELIKKHNEELITFNLGIHGLYTNNLEYIKKCIEFAKENNLSIHMHFCENRIEREDIIKAYKVITPVDVIESEFSETHNIFAHCVKLEDKDIEKLKNTNSHISHCPVSNLKLGCGIANVNKMLEQGINVSLGTDGQGSGSNLDLFETMKFTALLQKGINENPELLSSYEVLKMATINGAKALKLEEKIGSIEEDKCADIIIINIEDVLTIPINNIFSEIVYNVKGSNVETTIINGKIIMEDRKILNINQQEIFEKNKKIIQQINTAI